MHERKDAAKPPNRYLINIALVLSALSFIAAIITKDLWPIMILIPSTIFLHRHKAKSKAEEDRRDNLTIISYSIVLLLPAGLILMVLVYLIFWKLGPNMVSNWPR